MRSMAVGRPDVGSVADATRPRALLHAPRGRTPGILWYERAMTTPGRSMRWVGPLAAVLGALGLLYALRSALTPIFLALGIAYLLDPLVDRFEARRVPRGAAITLVFSLIGVGAALFLLLVLPGVVQEVAHYIGELPGILDGLRRTLAPQLTAWGIPVPQDAEHALAQLGMEPAELAQRVAEPLEALVRSVLGGTVSLLGGLASAVVVPMLAFYLLYDFDRFLEGARDLVPPKIRPWMLEITAEIDAVLGQFVRGQLLVMLAMGALYAVAYALVGIRLAVPIGMVAGLLAFIPYVGSGSALAMGLLMCVLHWEGWTQPVLVVVAYAVCQTLEGFVIVPRIVGDKVGLPAVWVIVSLMVGGDLFGFLGVLLALPVAAVLKIFVVRGMRSYRRSALYREGAGIEGLEAFARSTAPDPAPSDAGESDVADEPPADPAQPPS